MWFVDMISVIFELIISIIFPFYFAYWCSQLGSWIFVENIFAKILFGIIGYFGSIFLLFALADITGYKIKLGDSCTSYDAKNGFCDYIDYLNSN